MKLLLSLFLSLASFTVMAGACTYQEAIMAYESGNMKRAEVLLQMAARDGDVRAVVKLAEVQIERVATTPPADLLTVAEVDR